MEEKKIDHFYIFNTLFTKEEISEELIKKNFNPFLANRQLLNIPEMVFLLNNFNDSSIKLSPVEYYNLLKKIIPQMKRSPWLKVVSTKKKEDEVVKMIAEYYNCSYRVASNYLKFAYLNEKFMQEIEYNHHVKIGDLSNWLKGLEKKEKKKKTNTSSKV